MEEKLNEGYDPAVIYAFRTKMEANGSIYLVENAEENTEEYAQFRFIGKHNGQEVIFDAAMYTLRLHHESELYEIAERRAAKHFPDYKKIVSDENDSAENLESNDPSAAVDPLEEEIGLFMAEVILELEEEESVKVKEHIDIDADTDFGIILDVGLHVEKIIPEIIEKFIREFNNDTLKLDETLYCFQTHEQGD